MSSYIENPQEEGKYRLYNIRPGAEQRIVAAVDHWELAWDIAVRNPLRKDENSVLYMPTGKKLYVVNNERNKYMAQYDDVYIQYDIYQQMQAGVPVEMIRKIRSIIGDNKNVMIANVGGEWGVGDVFSDYAALYWNMLNNLPETAFRVIVCKYGGFWLSPGMHTRLVIKNVIAKSITAISR